MEEMEEADEEESETVEPNSETEMNSEESCTYYYTRK